MFDFMAAVAWNSGGTVERQQGIETFSSFGTNCRCGDRLADGVIIDPYEPRIGVIRELDSNSETDEDNSEGVIDPSGLSDNADGISHRGGSLLVKKWGMSRDAEMLAMIGGFCQSCELSQSLRHDVADLGGVGESLATKPPNNERDGLRIKVASDFARCASCQLLLSCPRRNCDNMFLTPSQQVIGNAVACLSARR